MSTITLEKEAFSSSPAVQSVSSEDIVSYNAIQKSKAKRKVDFTVLPLLVLGLLVFQLERSNLASALTDGFAKDIKVNQNTINLGNQLMFMGIVLLEIPFSIILQRLGPRKWLSIQVLLFGFVATMQVFVKNRTGFLLIRLILGFSEGGYIPGASFTLSCWYTRSEIATRIAILFFGMFGGNALSPILASGILKLGGRNGLKGWQWIFLLEGAFTMFVSVLLFFLLPGSPDEPKPLVGPGLIRFSEADRDALYQRLEDDGSRRHSSNGLRIPLKIVWKTVMHYKRWPHYVSTFLVFSTWAPLTTYTPSIILAEGFDRISANALASVGATLALVVVFIIAYLSDRTNRRGLWIIVAQVCYLIALIVAHSVQPRAGKWGRWGLWTVVNAFAVGYHPSHNSWVQLNCKDARERSVAIAIWVMSAISGLMVGTQFFRASDAPRYQTGLRTMIILVALGILFALLQEWIYYVHNRKFDKLSEEEKEDGIRYVL